MKFKGTIATELSGSLGGITAAHNRGGSYFRARTVPVNPATPEQEVVRGILAGLATRWVDILSQAERDSWDTYAENRPLPDVLGEPRNIGGLAMYVRSNTPRIQSGRARVDLYTGNFGLGGYTAPTFLAPSEATQDVGIAFDNTDSWANEDGAALLIYASRAQNASINFFKGPYRLAGAISGDAVIPPVSPATKSLPFAFVAGQKLFFRVNVTRFNGRLSTELRFSSIAGA